MTPRVTGISERNVQQSNGTIVKAVVLTYMVASYGPFTLVTNQTDIASGAAAAAMQTFADSLMRLPINQ